MKGSLEALLRTLPPVAALDRRCTGLEAALDERDGEIARLKAALAERDARIATLEAAELELYVLRSDHQRTVELADRTRRRVAELEQALADLSPGREKPAAEVAAASTT